MTCMGFRLDYAYGPPDDFWVDFRRACRAAQPDCWLFGEVIHTASTLRDYMGLMDGGLDFPLAKVSRKACATRRWPLPRFEAFLSAHEAYFPLESMRPAFLDNHDMDRGRFIADEEPARGKRAAFGLFTLAGPPRLYNGPEAGVTQTRPIHQGLTGATPNG